MIELNWILGSSCTCNMIKQTNLVYLDNCSLQVPTPRYAVGSAWTLQDGNDCILTRVKWMKWLWTERLSPSRQVRRNRCSFHAQSNVTARNSITASPKQNPTIAMKAWKQLEISDNYSTGQY